MPTTPFYIGSYSGAIHLAWLDGGRQELRDRRVVARTTNPSYLAIDPRRRRLYAVNEYTDGRHGEVRSYAIEEDGSLTETSVAATGGKEPCFVSIAPDGSTLFVANYRDGSWSSFALDDEGEIEHRTHLERHVGSGPVGSRQEGPHCHCARTDPDGRHLFICDLGTDAVEVRQLDPSQNGSGQQRSTIFRAPAGSGPRQIVLSGDGQHAYILCELTGTLLITRFDGERRELDLIAERSIEPGWFSGEHSGGGLALSRDGRWLYASSRGSDTIARIHLHASGGAIEEIVHVESGGRKPRDIALSPDDRWLLAANRGGENVSLLEVDPALGAPRLTSTRIEVVEPSCIVMAEGLLDD